MSTATTLFVDYGWRSGKKILRVYCLILSCLMLPASLYAQSDCPTIVNTSPASITVCTGSSVDSLQVRTSHKIAFYRFDAPQVNPYASHDGIFLDEAEPSGGLATIRTIAFPPNTGPASKTYYVYSCLKPEPTDTTCRPFTLLLVTIKPNPVARVKAMEATCSGTVSASDGAVVITGFSPTDTYALAVNGQFSGQSQPIPNDGLIVRNLSRTGQAVTYSVRVYSNGCYAEKTVTLVNASCSCPADRCVPFVVQKIVSRR